MRLAGIARKPESYQAVWYQYDNSSGQATRFGGTTGSGEQFQAPAGLPQQTGAYIKVEISANSAEHLTWKSPVDAYFLRTGDGWKLIGFERIPEKEGT